MSYLKQIEDLHNSACKLWEYGFSVLPTIPKVKIPAINWVRYQTHKASKVQLDSWWSARNPDQEPFGIAVVNGLVSNNVVLDFDPSKGHSIDELIREAEDYFSQEFPDTCRVSTCGGGYHDHFTCNATVHTVDFFSGEHGKIQLRGEGSIVVMPPTKAQSKRANDALGEYAYVNPPEKRIPWEDTWMAEVVTHKTTDKITHDAMPSEPTQEEIDVTRERVWSQLTHRAQKLLDGDVPTTDRSQQCYWLGCELVRSGVNDRETLAKLLMTAPYCREKYNDPSRGKEWGHFGHALKLADRVLKDADRNPDIKDKPTQTTTSATPAKPAKEKEYVLINMKDVKPEKPKFLIEPYLPLGEVTMLDGDPSAGKSWVWMAIAAGLTGSKICPIPYDTTATKNAKILVLTTEDDLHDTLSNRLMQLGARMENINVIGVKPKGEKLEHYHDIEGITASDFENVKSLILQVKPDLIVIDPIVLYASGAKDFDNSSNTSVRALMTDIKIFSRRIGCAALVVRHFRKQGASKAIHRGAGSMDYVASARSVMIVAKDKNTGQNAVAHAKSNKAALGPTMIFELTQDEDPPFKWNGVAENIRADQLADDFDSEKENEKRDALLEAIEFLTEELNAGPVPTEEINNRAKKIGINESTIKRARKELGVLSRRATDANGKIIGWVLELKGGS